MMMMGLHFMKEVPFRTVYIHALVRDEKGAEDVEVEGQRRRSAGPDRRVRRRRAALHAGGDGGAGPRHQALASSASRAIATSPPSCGTRRALPQMNGCVRETELRSERGGARPSTAGSSARRRAPPRRSTAGIEAYRFNEAASALYQFVWSTFCDWYIELIKPILIGDDEAAKAETRATHRLGARPDPAAAAPVHAVRHRGAVGATGRGRRRAREPADPQPLARRSSGLADAEADAEIDWLVRLVSEIRSVRAEMNVPAGAKIPLVLVGAGKADARARRASRGADRAARPARCHLVRQGAAQGLGADRAGRGDRGPAARGRHRHGRRAGAPGEEIEKAQAEIAKIDAKLATPTSSPRRRPRWSRRTASARPRSRRS